MANENWNPGTGKAIPTNTPIKVDPRFTTVGLPGAINGFVPFSRPGQTKAYYSINEFGEVAFKFGPNAPTLLDFLSGNTYTTLNDLASKTQGASTGRGVEIRTGFQSDLQSQLENRAPQLGIRPTGTLPPPAAPGAQGAPTQTPGSAAAGPNVAEYNPNVLNEFNDELKDFNDPNITNESKILKFLKYPINSIENGQDKILISQIQYVPSTIGTARGLENIAGALGNREDQFQQIKLLGTVMLPMPNDISETNQTAWGESSLSTIAAAFMGSASGVAGAIANAQGGEAINEFRRFLGDLGNKAVSDRLEKFLTANAGASVLKFGGINVDPEAYINRATGVAINPNLELLFNGPKLRQFGFSFKMTPRSSEEARNIRSIVKYFKKGMAPRRSTEADKSIYLGTPNVFRLKFVTGADKDIGGIGRIKTCALVSCTVNYTPDGFYAAYDGPNGSQPIATVMQLAFTELTPVYNDEYDANDEYNIGPDNFKKLEFETTRPNYTQGAPQGPTPGGASVDTREEVNRIRQQALIQAGAPLPGGG